MRLFNILAAGCLALISASAQAENVTGLYQVREPVTGQGAEARAAATIQALDTLVTRLTGDPKAAQSPALAALRKDPQQIINQVASEAGPPESVLVEFDPGSTERALRKAGLALWGSNRPSILGWWLNDSVEGSNLVGDGQASAQPCVVPPSTVACRCACRWPTCRSNWWPMPSRSKAVTLRRCAKPQGATAPMPCWRCMPGKPMANGRANGSFGWATSVNKALPKVPTRQRWPTP